MREKPKVGTRIPQKETKGGVDNSKFRRNGMFVVRRAVKTFQAPAGRHAQTRHPRSCRSNPNSAPVLTFAICNRISRSHVRVALGHQVIQFSLLHLEVAIEPGKAGREKLAGSRD